MKHTKGPWSVGKQPMNIVNVSCVVAEANPLIEEFKANAYLIAAAPEMLEALKELYGFINSGVLQFNERGGAINLPKACAKAFAAIAKAEGKP